VKEALLVAAGGAAVPYSVTSYICCSSGFMAPALLLPSDFLIVAWDKLAETCHQYLRKGRKVHVEGRLQTRPYTGQDGIGKYATEIVL
jgi:hypothetical protein